MTDTDQFDDRHIIALTAWGEARGEGHDAMQGVINSGQNRAASGVTWWERRCADPADTLRSIFLKHLQYDCWTFGDPNRPKLFSVSDADPQLCDALEISDAAIAGTLGDLTNGADSYFDKSLINKPPKWAIGKQPSATIGRLLFYKTI